MGYGVKKKRYLVLIWGFNYNADKMETLVLELFDNIDEAKEFAKKAENESVVNRCKDLSISIKIAEIKSTNVKSALERLRAEFPKSNLNFAN